MLRQHVSNDCDRSGDPVCELLLTKAMVHCGRDALPELVAAFLVNRLVANDGELVSTRRDKNQHRIALLRLVHTEPMKLLLRRDKRITVQLSALDQNADFTGRFQLGFPNRLNNPVVLEFAEEFPGSHLITSSIRRRLRRNFRRHR